MTISLIARFVVVAFLCAVPLVQHNSYWLHVLSLALIGAILAMGLQLLVGMAGVLSLGQGAFYGIGAYHRRSDDACAEFSIPMHSRTAHGGRRAAGVRPDHQDRRVRPAHRRRGRHGIERE